MTSLLLWCCVAACHGMAFVSRIHHHHQEINCINTATGIVNLCKWPSGMQVEQELLDLHTASKLPAGNILGCLIPQAVNTANCS